MPDIIPDVDAIPDTPQEMYFIKRSFRALQARLAVLEQAQAQPGTAEELRAAIAQLELRVGVLERVPDPVIPTVAAKAVESCRVFNSVAISTTSGVEKTLTFDSEVWDTGNMHSTTSNTDQVVIPKTGKYLTGMAVIWDAAGGNTRQVKIKKNGTTIAYDLQDVATSNNHAHVIATLHEFTAGDVLTFTAYQASTVGLNILAEQGSPGAWAVRIGDEVVV